VERVVITSSIAGIISWEFCAENNHHDRVFSGKPSLFRDTKLHRTDSILPRTRYPTPTCSGHQFQLPPEAYWASKSLAWEVTVKFINDKNSALDIVTLKPSVVLGKHDLDPSRICELVTSTFFPLAPLIRGEAPFNVTGHIVHVDGVDATTQ
jgi:hypothetical protein